MTEQRRRKGPPDVDWPRKVYVEPTSRCNLNCRTCMRRTWQEPVGDMSWDVFEALVTGLAEMPGPHTVAFAGIGEPLVHPRFAEMVALAHAAGLRTEVTTNALLLTADLAHELRRVGLDQLVVSVDGASDDSYGAVRSGASLERLVDNLRALRDYSTPYYSSRVRIGMEFVAMRSTIADLPRMGRIAALIGASFVMVSNVLPYSAELVDEVLYGRVATAAEGSEGSAWSPRWSLPRMDVNDLTEGPLRELLRGVPNVDLLDIGLDSRNNVCPFVSAGALAVGWSGRVSPCPPLTHSYPVFVMGREKHMRAWEIGKLPDDSLADLWQRREYRDFRRRVLDFDFSPCTDCGGCDLAETNEEDCFGNHFPVCGDCLWARGIIRCA